jgi:hypothetical protein
MAIDKKIASGLAPKQRAIWERFEALVSAAEATKDAATPVADFVKAAQRFASFDAGSEAFSLLAAIDGTDALKVVDSVKLLAEALSPKVETVDRTEGDLAASVLKTMAEGGALEDDAVPVALGLVERWVATKPVRSSSGEAPADLGFRVRTVCGQPGCKWDSYTDKNNLNSARHQAIVHARDTHSIELSTRKGGSAEKFASLTAAFKAVGIESDQNEQQASGADFTVKRAS